MLHLCVKTRTVDVGLRVVTAYLQSLKALTVAKQWGGIGEMIMFIFAISTGNND